MFKISRKTGKNRNFKELIFKHFYLVLLLFISYTRNRSNLALVLYFINFNLKLFSTIHHLVTSWIVSRFQDLAYLTEYLLEYVRFRLCKRFMKPSISLQTVRRLHMTVCAPIDKDRALYMKSRTVWWPIAYDLHFHRAFEDLFRHQQDLGTVDVWAKKISTTYFPLDPTYWGDDMALVGGVWDGYRFQLRCWDVI